MIRKSFLSLLGLTLAGTAKADWALNMPKGITELSLETYNLHMMVFWGCVAIGFGLSQLLFVWLLLTSEKGERATNWVWEGSHGLEWTVPSPAPYHTFDTPPQARIANEAFD
jgi:heme/copper-type cytochrome/quinol oxidase subunit 1